MELSSPAAEQKGESAGALESQIRELYGRTVYSHKVHEKDADLYSVRLKRIKIAQIVLSAVTTGSLITALVGDEKSVTLIGTVFATALFILTTYTKDYNLGELSQKHAQTAAKLWSVRESYLSLLTDIASETCTASDVQKRRNKLQLDLQGIYEAAPRTSSKAYGYAQKALKFNEELTFSDEEIDQFLPNELRRSHSVAQKALNFPPSEDNLNSV